MRQEVGLSPGDFVLDGDLSPLPKRRQSPKFLSHVYCGQTAGWIKIIVGMEVGLSPSDFILMGIQPPPQFLAHFCCGETAGCIKMPLRIEVGLIPGDFVFDGDPAPSPKRGQSPQFSDHVYCCQKVAWIRCHLVRR